MISQSLLDADNRHPTSSYSIPLQADIATKDRGSDTATNEGFSPLGMCRKSKSQENCCQGRKAMPSLTVDTVEGQTFAKA